MCSLLDDDVGVTHECSQSRPVTVNNTLDIDLCMKCHRPAELTHIRTDEVVCSQCLLSRTTHKFRSEFGKSRLIRDKEKVLVAYSGGSGSSAMVHLIQEGVSRRALKKLRFLPTLLYIDDGCILCTEERYQIVEAVVRKMHSTGLPYYVYRLEQCTDANKIRPWLCNTLSNDDTSFDLDFALKNWASESESDIGLSSVFNSAKTPTAKQSLLYILRRDMMLQIARSLSFNKVLVGDSATGLATRIISFITQGRGAELYHEMTFADTRNEHVVIVRPMREFSIVEVEVYNHLNGIEPVSRLRQVSNANSIESLCKKFVLGLQSEHENTVSIICRTAEKLGISETLDSSAMRTQCLLCHAVMDVENCASDISHSLRPADVARNNVTTESLHSKHLDSVVSLKASAMCSEVASGSSLQAEIVSHLCYACQRIGQEMTDITALPISSCEHYSSSSSRMQQIVDDFLIKEAEQQLEDTALHN